MSEAGRRVQSLAEATNDPDMKLYLMRLALTWMQSAKEAEDKASKAA